MVRCTTVWSTNISQNALFAIFHTPLVITSVNFIYKPIHTELTVFYWGIIVNCTVSFLFGKHVSFELLQSWSQDQIPHSYSAVSQRSIIKKYPLMQWITCLSANIHTNGKIYAIPWHQWRFVTNTAIKTNDVSVKPSALEPGTDLWRDSLPQRMTIGALKAGL